MATYFADTAFWIALSRRRDQYHPRAIAWRSVLWEWLNALADTTTRSIAAEGYRRVFTDSRVEVITFDPELNGAAVDLYRRRIDKDWSLTDCLSFVVMERRGLIEGLTTDHHFEQAGMKALMLSLPSL
ncbi:MAG: hypothetical protein JNL98_32590 [Bryobacterales bacterium]|nr:hypothetical protein [Bryobacterales bacterium]